MAGRCLRNPVGLLQIRRWKTVQAGLNVMAHAQKPYFVFQRNGRVRLNRRERQFSRRRAGEVCASAVVMLAAPCSEVVWRVLVTHSIRQFVLHFPSSASPCAITFQPESNKEERRLVEGDRGGHDPQGPKRHKRSGCRVITLTGGIGIFLNKHLWNS